ncbi:hypothetical protein RL2162 [Rhizobium johnstonii 3841]|uniref:Uncharacterized protein n=1 Tax=Rhizobium johnstonii (strain DSM 114642 / LMG 32736 / 3841) TaxID=216596 RepID=Q1MHB1_RHIJ3|nr:hypothetical protein RL2162 [Rhizobium johnstonii 3841]
MRRQHLLNACLEIHDSGHHLLCHDGLIETEVTEGFDRRTVFGWSHDVRAGPLILFPNLALETEGLPLGRPRDRLPQRSCTPEGSTVEEMRPCIQGFKSFHEVGDDLRIIDTLHGCLCRRLPSRPRDECVIANVLSDVIDPRRNVVHEVEVDLPETDRIDAALSHFQRRDNPHATGVVEELVYVGKFHRALL